MQKVTSLNDIERAISVNGEMVVSKENNVIVVMSIEEYNKKLIEKKLINADKQIKEGKTVKASDVFKELQELYEF